MAVSLTFPDSVKKHLVKSKQKGVFGVRDAASWFGRRFLRQGELTLMTDQEHRIVSQVQSVVAGKGSAFELLVEAPADGEEGESALELPAPVKGRVSFVEKGFEFTTHFHGVLSRRADTGGGKALVLADVRNLRVGYGLYAALVKKGDLSLLLRGSVVSLEVQRVSLRRVIARGELPPDIGEEGVTVDKATLSLGAELTELPVSVKIAPSRGVLDAQISFQSEEARDRLANYIEQRWSGSSGEQTKRRAAVRAKPASGGPRGGGGGNDGEPKRAESGGSIDDIYKSHLFILGPDYPWTTELEKFSVLHRIPNADTEQVLADLDDKRCDMILADADLWAEDALGLAMHLRSHKKHQRIPVFWFGGPENIFAEAEGQDLIDLGAYDYLDSDINSEELMTRLRYARRVNRTGEGEVLVIISPDGRMQYRLGMALADADLEVIKETSPENFVASLNENNARYILVDGVSLGDMTDRVLGGCLSWAKKGSNPSQVFLMSTRIRPEEAQQWVEKGIGGFIVYDPAMTGVAQALRENIARFAPEKPPEQSATPQAEPGAEAGGAAASDPEQDSQQERG